MYNRQRLINVERQLFDSLHIPYNLFAVNIPPDGRFIWTFVINGSEHKSPPLVLLHGLAGGCALWLNNLVALSDNGCRTVYAIDLVGFGRSSRQPKFAKHPDAIEREWIESIECWRQAMGIDQMLLLGHSLGAYIASIYTLNYGTKHVRLLILVDPWGFNQQSADTEDHSLVLKGRPAPLWFRVLAPMLFKFNPLASIRAVGPFGLNLMRRVRPDLGRRYSGASSVDPTLIYEYIYQCNAQTPPSGESAFCRLIIGFGWARRPLRQRFLAIDQRIPITFIYGSRTFIDTEPAYYIRNQLTRGMVDIQIIDNCGHLVMVDNVDQFNRIIVQQCLRVQMNNHGSGNVSIIDDEPLAIDDDESVANEFA